MSAAFNSLPDVQDRVDALCAFMRRQAISQGLSGPNGSINKDLHRRMGNKRHWEDGRCPMIEFQWIVPRSLGMPSSLMYSLEIVDECVAAAANVHILDLVKQEWQETEEPEVEEWEPPNTIPLVNEGCTLRISFTRIRIQFIQRLAPTFSDLVVDLYRLPSQNESSLIRTTSLANALLDSCPFGLCL